jgi:diguanylate cyclase (GGDEF)-like protein
LTGLYNHRYMEESFEREAGANASCGRSVGLILLDLDRFKIVSC